MKNTIVCYHKNCTDGFGAAYAAWCKLQDSAEYVAVQYGDDFVEQVIKALDLPYDTFADYSKLYLGDFSVGPDLMFWLSRQFSEITVIDHHESAVRKLQESNNF